MALSPKPKTYSRQHELPRLPVPPLENTLNVYLGSLRPLLSSEELARQQSLADDFAKTIGPKLQQRLIDLDRASPYNWLDDQFWLKKAYQEWREALCVNSNWYILCQDDPNHPRHLLDDNNGVRPKGEFGDFQVKRAAKLISCLLDYKDTLDSEQIPIDTLRDGKPLCMYQYGRLFGVTRIPLPGCDELVHTPRPVAVRHIVVLVRDQIYRLDVYEESGSRVSESEIEQRINSILHHLDSSARLAPISLLTAAHRDRWSAARQHLLTLSPVNRESLSTIEDSLFSVSLDDYAAGSSADAWGKNVFVGDRGKNRWFDKALTVIVESNGKAGINGEHSPCDALIPSLIVEQILAFPTTSHLKPHAEGKSQPPLTYKPKKLEWVTDQAIQRFLHEAGLEVGKIVDDSDTTVLYWREYGTDFVKKVAKLPPDAYFQMTLQLTYYRLHHALTPTYETASTRQFLHGRTETTRTLSAESAAFVRGWTDSSLSPAEKYALLKAAVAQHSRYQSLASKGWGCDRHLLGLRILNATQPDTEMHPLFKEPAFAASTDFRLSTSGLHAGKRLMGTGFGAATPDGYGINYMAAPSLVKYGIETKKSSKWSKSSRDFSLCLEGVLKDMKVVCEAVNGGGNKEEKTARL